MRFRESLKESFSGYFPLIFETPHNSVVSLTFHSAIIGYKLIEGTINGALPISVKKQAPGFSGKAETHRLNVERFESISKDYIDLLQKMMREIKHKVSDLSLPSRIPYKAGDYLVTW